MLLDQLYLRLQLGSHPRYYDTVGVMLPGVVKRMGVPTSVVREAAKNIIRAREGRELLQEALTAKLETHEVILVVGLVLSMERSMAFPEKLAAADRYAECLTNWATVDSFAQSFTDLAAHRDEGRTFVEALIDSPNPWRVRLGIVLVLMQYASESELAWTLEAVTRPNAAAAAREHYYVSMGLAWALSEALIRFPAAAAPAVAAVVDAGRLDAVTVRRALQKVRDSYRLGDAQKKQIQAVIGGPLAKLPVEKTSASAHPAQSLPRRQPAAKKSTKPAKPAKPVEQA